MQKKQLARAALMVFAAAALLGVGYVAGTHRSTRRIRHQPPRCAATSASSDKIDPKTGRKVLYWHDPMVPNQHFDKPGKSPFMDMQLRARLRGRRRAPAASRSTPGLQQNLGIRYATVRRQETTEGFDAVGTTQFDESQADVVQSRVTGYIDHLYAQRADAADREGRADCVAVRARLAGAAGRVPGAQTRRHGRRHARSGTRAHAGDVDSGRRRLPASTGAGKAQTHVMLSSPETGVVSELNVRDGAMVTPGQTLAKVAGLSKLWLIVEIPEALALQRAARHDRRRGVRRRPHAALQRARSAKSCRASARAAARCRRASKSTTQR